MVKLNIVATLIIISVATVFATCNKKKECVRNNYSFDIKMRAYPDKDSIMVGDTIYFELKEPVMLRESGGNLVDYSGAGNLGTVVAFGELSGNSNERDAANDFTCLTLKGRETPSSNSQRFRQYLFSEDGSFYVFKIAIIPKKTGIFRLGVSDARNVYTNNNPCDRSGFRITFDQTNQHLHYALANYGVSPPLPNGVYCFKVK